MAKLGVLFDIDALDGGFNGYEAYKILFQAVPAQDLANCSLSDGDTNATLNGRANQYCIAIESSDSMKIGAIRAALAKADAKGQLPLSARFMEENQIGREPLVPAGFVTADSKIVGDNAGWVRSAWQEVGLPATAAHQASVTELEHEPSHSPPVPGSAPGVKQAELSPELAKQLDGLKSSEAWVRKAAAETLAERNTSDYQLVAKLADLAENDPNKYVRLAALKALQAPAQQTILEQHQDLALKIPSLNMTAQATTLSPTTVAAPVERKQGGCLMTYLILVMLANAGLGLFLLVLMGDAPGSSGGFILLLALLSFAAAGFGFAILKWKRWGVYGFCTVIVIGALLALLDGDVGSALRGIIPMGILINLIRPIWGQLE